MRLAAVVIVLLSFVQAVFAAEVLVSDAKSQPESLTVAPGGVGKSALIVAEALAQVTGKSFLWDKPKSQLKVWVWNLEDPLEETYRRIAASCIRHGVSRADIEGRLFVNSGRDQRLVIAEMDHNKAKIMRPVVLAIVAEIKRLGIDVLVIDPFVSCHQLPAVDKQCKP